MKPCRRRSCQLPSRRQSSSTGRQTDSGHHSCCGVTGRGKSRAEQSRAGQDKAKSNINTHTSGERGRERKKKHIRQARQATYRYNVGYLLLGSYSGGNHILSTCSFDPDNRSTSRRPLPCFDSFRTLNLYFISAIGLVFFWPLLFWSFPVRVLISFRNWASCGDGPCEDTTSIADAEDADADDADDEEEEIAAASGDCVRTRMCRRAKALEDSCDQPKAHGLAPPSTTTEDTHTHALSRILLTLTLLLQCRGALPCS